MADLKAIPLGNSSSIAGAAIREARSSEESPRMRRIRGEIGETSTGRATIYGMVRDIWVGTLEREGKRERRIGTVLL